MQWVPTLPAHVCHFGCPDGSALFVVDSGTMLAAAASDAVGVGPSEAVVNHDASVSEYEPAATFGGVRPGWVFCTRDGLTGYFKDANPFTTWSPAPAAPISSGSASGTTPVARSRRFLLRLEMQRHVIGLSCSAQESSGRLHWPAERR
jgi:hypothetical protein